MFGISERAEGVENSLMALADYWEEGNERGAYFAALPSSYYLGLLYYNFLFYNIEGIYGLSNVPYILEQQGGENDFLPSHPPLFIPTASHPLPIKPHLLLFKII